MVSQLNSIPQFKVPLQTSGVTGKDWYFFWSGLYVGIPPAQVNTIVIGASPFTYSPQIKGTVSIRGGTISAVQFSRDGVNTYTLGATSGVFPVNAADRLIVTYTVIPTEMLFIPT